MCWLCYLVHLSSMACGKHFALGKEELKGCLSFASWINKWAVNVYSALSHSSPRSTSMLREMCREIDTSRSFNLGFSNSFGWFKSLIIIVTSDEWHFLCWKSAPINVLYRRVESVSEELLEFSSRDCYVALTHFVFTIFPCYKSTCWGNWFSMFLRDYKCHVLKCIPIIYSAWEEVLMPSPNRAVLAKHIVIQFLPTICVPSYTLFNKLSKVFAYNFLRSLVKVKSLDDGPQQQTLVTDQQTVRPRVHHTTTVHSQSEEHCINTLSRLQLKEKTPLWVHTWIK